MYLAAMLYLKAVRVSGTVPDLRQSPMIPEPLEVTGDSQREIRLTLLDVIPECSALESEWTYKSKVRIILLNDNETTIEVAAPGWSPGQEGIPFQKPFAAELQVEGPKGWEKNDWLKPDSTRIYVRPKQAFRVWIGLGVFVGLSRSERNDLIRHRFVMRKLGILELLVKTHTETVEYKLPL